MHKHLFPFLLLLLISVKATAQLPDYTISSIPDSLKKNADAVVRNNSSILEIKSKSKALYTEDKTISILNPAAEDLATIVIPYNGKETVTDFKAWLYDGTGTLVSQFSKRNAQDFSNNGQNEITDDRVKVWQLNTINPPFTIHYVYQLELHNTFFMPRWQPAYTANTSIENAAFRLINSAKTAVNIKASNCRESTAEENTKKWEIRNFKALKETNYSPPVSLGMPKVIVMLKEFELYGTTGMADSWNSLGSFINTLNHGRDENTTLTDPQIDKALQDAESKHEKVCRLYHYLQNNFRYVSIQKGLGGWQPQTAAYTFGKKFGDCKALTTEMKALLKKADIESYYTLINTNDDRVELNEAFPHSYFNHVILCVPLPNDTMWLECTSAINPAGYLGSFTENRNALLIFNQGARIIHTPAYTETANTSTSNSEINLSADNITHIKTTLIRTGELQERLRSAFLDKDDKITESVIYKNIRSANTKIESFKAIEISQASPLVSTYMELSNQSTIKKTASRLFVKTDILKPQISLPDKSENRNLPIEIETGFTQTDTMVYHLGNLYEPENFERIHNEKVISDFGQASIHVHFDNESGDLKICRTFCLKEGSYEPARFKDFNDFMAHAIKVCCPDLVLKYR